MKNILTRLLIVNFVLTLNAENLLSQYKNSIELDFGGGYIVFTPKHSLHGDQFNPYLDHNSGMSGLNYERNLGLGRYAIKAGGAVVKQGRAGSVHVPVQLNRNFIGERGKSRFNAGFAVGVGFNYFFSMDGGVFIPFGAECDVSFKKRFYLAPHTGVGAALNLGRFAITTDFLFHCFIPEFLLYTVSYTDTQNNRIVEYNTNRNIGVTLNFGIMCRFGKS